MRGSTIAIVVLVIGLLVLGGVAVYQDATDDEYTSEEQVRDANTTCLSHGGVARTGDGFDFAESTNPSRPARVVCQDGYFTSLHELDAP